MWIFAFMLSGTVFTGYRGLAPILQQIVAMSTPANVNLIPVLFDGQTTVLNLLNKGWLKNTDVSDIVLFDIKSQKNFLIQKNQHSFKILILNELGALCEVEEVKECGSLQIISLFKKHLGIMLTDKSNIYCIAKKSVGSILNKTLN